VRVLEHFVEPPRACSYLPGRSASLDVKVILDVTPSELDDLLERGWRRFGAVYFRPACAACSECVSLSVRADRFEPTKSQRRAERACAGLRRVVGPPLVDDARLALYAKWHSSREDRRGWEQSPQDRKRYSLEFAFPHPCAREAAFYDDEREGALVAVGLFDVTPKALSAIFFYYDPAYARLSPGTANVVSLVREAAAAGRSFVYLGYRVSGCASLRYKASFGPHELLEGRPEMLRDPARWRARELG
jgi:arginyl-tRNA--protein-N-Asp/Glu arginylyltransferase